MNFFKRTKSKNFSLLTFCFLCASTLRINITTSLYAPYVLKQLNVNFCNEHLIHVSVDCIIAFHSYLNFFRRGLQQKVVFYCLLKRFTKFYKNRTTKKL